MSLEPNGYVGLFITPFDQETIEGFVATWIDRFGSVEQTLGTGAQVLTQKILSIDDLGWKEKDLQFRVLYGEQFAWVYLTKGRRVIETSGLVPVQGSALCHDVLEGLAGCCEIIDERNDRRLDQLEAEGLM